MNRSRGAFISGSGAVFSTIAFLQSPTAAAAKFPAKAGTNQPPDHPVNQALRELWNLVRKDTNSQLDVSLVSGGQLGDDSALLKRLMTGEVQFIAVAGGILASVVPAVAVQTVGFAFNGAAQAYKAFDGELGDYVRKEIKNKNLYPFDKVFDNGSRDITVDTKPVRVAADLEGVKMVTSGLPARELFNSLGASALPLATSEVYTALQSKVADGTENFAKNIELAQLYQVQSYLCLSEHVWGAYWLLANFEFWNSLPSSIQAALNQRTAPVAFKQRNDVRAIKVSTLDHLARRGMRINPVDRGNMRAKLAATNYYKNRRDEVGTRAWSLLESYTGKLI